MALTASEEALVRQLLGQQAAILSLAGNEATITSKLGATKVTLADLVAASTASGTDLLLTRQGTEDKSLTLALLSSFVGVGKVSTTGDQSVGGVKTFTSQIVASGGVQGNTGYPTIRPSLNLDFANTKTLDPRVTFARASTATFYDGRTVAKAEENLITQSESTSITMGGATNNGDGTFTLASATNWVFRTRGAETPANTQITVSVTLSGTGRVRLTALNGGGTAIGFDVEITLTATPTRYSWTGSSGTSGVNVGPLVRGAADNSSATVKPEKWQMELRGQATAYTPTTTQRITNYIPVLQTAAANVARFDHNPLTGESLGLLIEEQRTNLLLRSQEFENASWTKTGVTVATNQAIAPDGTLTADMLVETVGASIPRAIQSSVTVNGTAYTASFFVKSAGRTQIRIVAEGSSNFASFFDLSLGTVVSPGGQTTAAISAVGNGWFRCSITYTATAVGSSQLYVATAANGASIASGDGFSGIYIWGAQLEVGAFPTSYIPTVASQVTRSADAAVMTGANFSSWYRADEGTIFGDVSYIAQQSNSPFISLNDGTANNRVVLGRGGFNNETRFGYNVSVGNVTQASSNTSTLAADANIKLALAYKVDDFQFTGNGVGQGADASGTLPVVNQAVIGTITGSPRMNGTIRKIAYWPERLSNAQLQALTT